MAAAKKIERIYSMDDLAMLELAQIFHNNFVLDEAEFVAAFPFLDTPFAANFQTAIDNADAIPSGAEVDSLITVITANLETKMTLGRAALQKLFTYADFAWSSKEMTNTFGKDRYLKARRSQLKMKELLELAHRQAEEATNKAALLLVGYTQGDIDGLETLVGEIDVLNSEQEDALSLRGIKTAIRLTAYNEVWGFMEKINRASKVVFVDSQAKLDMYLLYPTVHHGLPKVQNLVGVVNEGPPMVAALSWNTAVGVAEYQVYQSQVPVGQPAGEYEWVAAVVPNSWDQPILNGFRYWFKVRANNDPETGPFSNPVFVQP